VTMVMALTSIQLIATAMTPFAMTSHFTFNLAWLALVLRGDRLGHGLAAIVALLAAGLHQWHFPLLFIGPFILWMAANRRLASAADRSWCPAAVNGYSPHQRLSGDAGGPDRPTG